MTISVASRVYACITVVSLGLLLTLAGCAPRNTAAESGKEPTSAAANVGETPLDSAGSEDVEARGYVGNAACADCHSREFHDHSGSSHARALHLMTPEELGDAKPPTGPLTHTPTTLRLVNNVYQVDTALPRGFALPLQYAFGAGKFCFTFVGLLPGNKSFELRASYVPHSGQWRPTPGQEYLNSSSFGLRHGIKDTRQCFGCHVTALPTTMPTPEKRFLGVGCEACHGPGKAHVDAMRSGQAGASATDLHIDNVARWGARRQNEMCGRCHRTGADVNAKQPQLVLTARFQPYGLMLSRCFKESNDTLACTNCHNPHQNTSHDLRAYEAACLRCHSKRGQGSEVRGQGNALGEKGRRGEGETDGERRKETGDREMAVSKIENRKSKIGNPCPVNPRAGCIGCHMPKRKMLPDSTLGTFAADHFIRVNRTRIKE